MGRQRAFWQDLGVGEGPRGALLLTKLFLYVGLIPRGMVPFVPLETCKGHVIFSTSQRRALTLNEITCPRLYMLGDDGVGIETTFVTHPENMCTCVCLCVDT